MAIVFVNDEKLGRAKRLQELLSSAASPTPDEMERMSRFGRICADAGIDPKKKDETIKFIYEKLGGLIRTEEEQKVADVKKREAQEKGKKRKIE